MDLLHQLLDHHLAVLADVVGVGRHDLLAVPVLPGEGEDLALFVIGDLDLRVHPEGEGPCRDTAGLGGVSAAGEKGCRQDSQGRCRCKKLSSFHGVCSSRK